MHGFSDPWFREAVVSFRLSWPSRSLTQVFLEDMVFFPFSRPTVSAEKLFCLLLRSTGVLVLKFILMIQIKFCMIDNVLLLKKQDLDDRILLGIVFSVNFLKIISDRSLFCHRNLLHTHLHENFWRRFRVSHYIDRYFS